MSIATAPSRAAAQQPAWPPAPRATVFGGPAAVLLRYLFVASVLTAAAVVLRPRGAGWSWGAPLDELRWYAGGLTDPATEVQLLGNLALLAPATACAVLLWPRLSCRQVLWCGAAAAVGIETLQWLLPLGRVVSPLDVLLNASGVVLSARLTLTFVRAHGRGRRRGSGGYAPRRPRPAVASRAV